MTDMREAMKHLDFLSGLPGVHPHRIAKIRAALAAPREPVTCTDCKGEGIKFDTNGDPDLCPTCSSRQREDDADEALDEWDRIRVANGWLTEEQRIRNSMERILQRQYERQGLTP